MKIKQILNTNAVIAVEENEDEVLLLGSGLGFKSKPGDVIRQEQIERQFDLQDKKHKSQFQEILKTIPKEYIIVAEDTIDFAVHKYQMALNETIHISLVEHIYYAIENFKQGLVVPNSILHDIIRFYPDEYKVGQKMLDLIETRFKCRLTNDEAGFIAMHFMTAQYTQVNGNTKKVIKLVRELNDLILSELNIKISEDSLTYYRYMTHLKSFAQRVMNKHHFKDQEGLTVLEKLLENYAKEYQCSQKVCAYIEENYNYKTEYDEMIYLTIHLARLKNN